MAYPYQKHIDEHKHLDTDEFRHLIKPVIHVVNQDSKGQEHLYCDKEQRDANGKYRRPKKMIEAEQRGFATAFDMMEFDRVEAEKAKGKELDELRATLKKQTELLEALMAKVDRVRP